MADFREAQRIRGMSSRLYPLMLLAAGSVLHADNPITRDMYTADPAAIVHDDTVYIYAGHDEAPEGLHDYVMNEWFVFSSKDMANWKNEGSPLSLDSFEWADRCAWASHVTERNGKFYWYVTVCPVGNNGWAIGVAVGDSPTGPFKDAIGKPLITSDMTPDPILGERRIYWDDIDPAVFIDDDGQAYMFWGNVQPKWIKLKENMIETEGEIQYFSLPNFVEAIWVHKHNGTYYLTYSEGFPEQTAYATADKITGPWTYQGKIKWYAGNSNTNHQAIITFKGRHFFIYHNGMLPGGGSHRRSVLVDELFYEPDGSIRRIVPTEEGPAPVK